MNIFGIYSIYFNIYCWHHQMEKQLNEIQLNNSACIVYVLLYICMCIDLVRKVRILPLAYSLFVARLWQNAGWNWTRLLCPMGRCSRLQFLYSLLYCALGFERPHTNTYTLISHGNTLSYILLFGFLCWQ